MQVIVPVKPFRAAKRRLAAIASPAERAGLAQAMAEHVLGELAKADGVGRVLVVCAEPDLRPFVRRHGFDLLEDEALGLNRAVAAAFRTLGGTVHTDVAVVHADLPLFDAAEFSRLVALHNEGPARKATLVFDRAGEGTNVRICRPGDGLPPLYGPGSALRHREAAGRLGIWVETVDSPTLSLDCDTPEDAAFIRQFARACGPEYRPVHLLAGWACRPVPLHERIGR